MPNPKHRETGQQIGRSLELIIFSAGGQDFGVEAVNVKEVRGWTPATLLPDSPAYMRGVINLRGAILPIVDLSARLELPEADPTSRHVVIVVWIGKRLVGLLVDAVCDILTVSEDALQTTPNVKCETVEALVPSLITVDDRMVGLLDLNHVLPALAEPAL